MKTDQPARWTLRDIQGQLRFGKTPPPSYIKLHLLELHFCSLSNKKILMSEGQVNINIDLDAVAAIQQRILEGKPTLNEPNARNLHPQQPRALASQENLRKLPETALTTENVQKAGLAHGEDKKPESTDNAGRVEASVGEREVKQESAEASAGNQGQNQQNSTPQIPQNVSGTPTDTRRSSLASNSGGARKHKGGYKAKRVFKVIIIGDAGVGKTCLSFRFCNNRFPQQTEATIGVDFRERTLHMEGELVRVQLWDTAGQERYRQSIVAHYYRNVNAVVFVYDVNNMKTFKSLPLWINECKKHGVTSDEVPHILIGNKVDLSTPNRVKTDEAQVFADQNDMALFETSALSQSEADHVEAIFMTLVHKLQQCKPMHVQSETERHQREEKLLLKASDLQAAPEAEGWCC
ncbi:unnamed protein product [Bursaphelenchus okinawaensis]|uniref:Uncharacterized protein n=1 Tax=Bursaphelenchus okinawaensis TaxID=465554 RepID=A0A811KDS3_9BILA|nr:unnamed protein product [Bursaphelenchus okinawaensis]CAG9101733.1 unnamed protein product [Bursaphelenchus okinawaensis]